MENINEDINLPHETSPYKPPSPKPEKEIMSQWKGDYEQPFVSIVCITYQHKDFIGDALNSLLMQETNFPFEIIVRDDASIDGTREIIESYAKKYPNIIKTILEIENQYSKGVKAFSSTIPRANGKFIAICEGDDYWCDVSKLEKQVNMLLAHPECVVTYHDAVYLSTACDSKPKTLLDKSGRKGFSRKELLHYSFMPTLTLCFKNVIKEFPEEYNNVLNGDTFIISLLGRYGNAIYVDDIKPAIYREHEGGIWSGLSREDKLINTITTYYWMSVYYKRTLNKSASTFYAFSVMNHMLSVVDINKSSFLKWFIIKYFDRTHALYFSLKNTLKRVIFRNRV